MKNLFTEKKSRRMKMGGIGIALLLLLAAATTSFAQSDVTGSLTVTGGLLTMAANDNPAFPEVTLDGTAQSTSDDIVIDVQDLTGTGAGWQLEVTSTTFTDGSHTLPTTALSITGVTSGCDGTTCTDPTNSITYTSFIVPADTAPPTAIQFFNAAAGTGLGDFTITPTFALAVPATTYAGNYSSTVTLTIANLP